MCLRTNVTKIKVATHDIKCYKVFQTFSSLTDAERASAMRKMRKYGQDALEPDTLVSPYQFSVYEIGKEYVEPHFSYCYQDMGFDFDITDNAIHAYRNKKEAKKCASFLHSCDIPKSGIIIAECVIPEGAHYALGETGIRFNKDNSYASEKLIIKAIVPAEKK